MRAPNFVFVFTPAGANAENNIDQIVFFHTDDSEEIRRELLKEAEDVNGESELAAVFELELQFGDGGVLHETSYTG